MMFDDEKFLDTRRKPQADSYQAWLRNALAGSRPNACGLVVLEIGVGTSVSSLRRDFEKLVLRRGAKLIRLNLDESELPCSIQMNRNGVAISMPALDALRSLDQFVQLINGLSISPRGMLGMPSPLAIVDRTHQSQQTCRDTGKAEARPQPLEIKLTPSSAHINLTPFAPRLKQTMDTPWFDGGDDEQRADSKGSDTASRPAPKAMRRNNKEKEGTNADAVADPIDDVVSYQRFVGDAPAIVEDIDRKAGNAAEEKVEEATSAVKIKVQKSILKAKEPRSKKGSTQQPRADAKDSDKSVRPAPKRARSRPPKKPKAEATASSLPEPKPTTLEPKAAVESKVAVEPKAATCKTARRRPPRPAAAKLKTMKQKPRPKLNAAMKKHPPTSKSKSTGKAKAPAPKAKAAAAPAMSKQQIYNAAMKRWRELEILWKTGKEIRVHLADETLVRFQQQNPKREGTNAYKRYEKYKVSRTIKQAGELGASPTDLGHDAFHGYYRPVLKHAT
eukprot:gnl/TRDRNA2_/TRDRNA2_172105_c5_seq2.p1 gnl/TRDRNA2_/TRDRNA2_172105_c5~~gnl/TRDRNA2_/TRDRNA2_172105_c5_seq2.p1  ORF type:complete len:535 (+),score=118.02 gnl/TRDRNA2_/TRDRNA2_172105_c5_seq2:97-1605(+)